MSQTQTESAVLFGPRPPLVLVGDTGVLMKDVLRSCRDPHTTSLQSGMHRGVVRLYIASHVFEEVERDLPGFALDRGCAQDALARWHKEYLPWLYVVDVPRHWGVDDPSVRAVMERHAVDGPTAQLAAVLGCPTLAEDPDLVENGFGSNEWLRLTLHTGGLAFQSETLQIVYIPSAMAVELARAAARAFARAPAWAQLLTLSALVWVALAVGDSEKVRMQLRSAGSGALQAVEWVAPRLSQLLEWQAAGEEEWSRQTLVVPVPPELEQALAQLLSRASGPSLAGDLARDLSFPGDLKQRTVEIGAVLQASSAFVQPRWARWQLGRPGAPTRLVDDELARRRVESFGRTLERTGAHLVQPQTDVASPLRISARSTLLGEQVLQDGADLKRAAGLVDEKPVAAGRTQSVERDGLVSSQGADTGVIDPERRHDVFRRVVGGARPGEGRAG